MNWVGSGENQVSGELSQPFTAFPTGTVFTSLPTVSFVIPNEQHNMHDGSISASDTWLKTNLSRYRNYCRKHNSLLIVTFDEAVNDGGDNHIATIFLGKQVRNGNNSQNIDHYNVLRTIEDMYGLPYAGNASSVVSITNCWR
jgi:acid phosphatase